MLRHVRAEFGAACCPRRGGCDQTQLEVGRGRSLAVASPPNTLAPSAGVRLPTRRTVPIRHTGREGRADRRRSNGVVRLRRTWLHVTRAAAASPRATKRARSYPRCPPGNLRGHRRLHARKSKDPRRTPATVKPNIRGGVSTVLAPFRGGGRLLSLMRTGVLPPLSDGPSRTLLSNLGACMRFHFNILDLRPRPAKIIYSTLATEVRNWQTSMARRGLWEKKTGEWGEGPAGATVPHHVRGLHAARGATDGAARRYSLKTQKLNPHRTATALPKRTTGPERFRRS